MSFILHNGVRIGYETFGEKPANNAVLFLSGAGSDRSMWNHQLTRLKQNHFLLAIDNRGSGESDRPDYPYDVEMMVADVAAVLKEEGIRRVHLVGYSLGGLIAQRFYFHFPSMVRQLMLFNCSLGSGNPDTVLPEQSVINMFLYSAALTREDSCRNAMDYSFGESLAQENPDLYEAYLANVWKNCPGISYQIPVMVSDKPLIENYEMIDIPVLCVQSLNDPVVPPQNGEVFKKYIPRARVEYLEGYHCSVLIHPEKVTQLIQSFLREN